jgi:hypothetical protein
VGVSSDDAVDTLSIQSSLCTLSIQSSNAAYGWSRIDSAASECTTRNRIGRTAAKTGVAITLRMSKIVGFIGMSILLAGTARYSF